METSIKLDNHTSFSLNMSVVFFHQSFKLDTLAGYCKFVSM